MSIYSMGSTTYSPFCFANSDLYIGVFFLILTVFENAHKVSRFGA